MVVLVCIPTNSVRGFLFLHTLSMEAFLKKLKIKLPYDSVVPFLGKKKKKRLILKDTCSPVFVVALFTSSQLLKLYFIYSYYKYCYIPHIVQYIFVAYFIHNSWYPLFPTLVLPLPTSLSLLVITSLSSISVSLLLFCHIHYFENNYEFVVFLGSTYEWLCTVFVSLSDLFHLASPTKLAHIVYNRL